MPRPKSRKPVPIVREPQIEWAPSNIGLYKAEPRPTASDLRQKVTVSVNQSLLSTIDDYVERAGTNRSAIFEQALLMWCQWLQEQSDIDYYANLTEADRAANDSWTQITTESAKHLFDK